MRIKNILQKVEPIWKKNENYDNIKPKITVILPIFETVKIQYFEKTVESIISQKYTNWELIIVDDTDIYEIEKLIKFYMETDSRINCIRHKYNLGLPAVSEYEAYLKSRGEFITTIFEDSILDEKHLYISMREMIKHDVKVTYGVSVDFNNQKKFSDEIESLEYLPIINFIDDKSVVIHKEVIEKIGLCDPHISLNKSFKWDFWRRISAEFEMLNINLVKTEDDSEDLINYVKGDGDTNSWIAIEQMSIYRNEILKPSNFEEYSILMNNYKNTEPFKLRIASLYCEKKDKIWYVENLNFFENVEKKQKKKRILLILTALDATFALGFKHLREDCIFKIAFFDSVKVQDILYADAIIYIRDLYNALLLHNKFAKYNITEYYYFDDNFVEIYEEYAKKEKKDDVNSILFNIRKSFTFENLRKFRKIIVSTENLKKYFENESLCENIEVLPPCLKKNESFELSKEEESINIAFMGGGFREDIFVKNIYPAIQKLTIHSKVKLVVPDSLVEKIRNSYKNSKNIIFIGVERSNCYEQVILKYKKENIKVLIHCGDENINNKYKTKNAVINALRLGSLLITSKIEPYSCDDDIISVSNKMQSWSLALEKICSDKDFQKLYFEKIKRIAYNHFDYNKVNSIFDNTIGEINSYRTIDILMRAQNILFYDLETIENAKKQINDYEERIIDDFLSFSTLKKSYVEYTISLNKRSIKEIGFIFSTENLNIKGNIYIEIMNNKGIRVKSKILKLEEIKIRELCYFKLEDKIYLSDKNKIKIHMEYDETSSKLFGIYENKLKRTFYYKFLNKFLGIKLPISNLVYYDCL